jgi:16S rRNA G1207 methylase RsmC
MSIRELVEPVGTFGMHLSGNVRGEDEDQLGAFLELKKQGLETVVMMWDSEKQAIHNTFGAARRLISIGLKVRIACLGEEGSTQAQQLTSKSSGPSIVPSSTPRHWK